MNSRERDEITQRVSALPLLERLRLLEHLIRDLRHSFEDHEALDKQMDAMLQDPGMQRVLRNEDLGPRHATG